jgi:hypothetical protein
MLLPIAHARDARLEEAQKYPGCRLMLACGRCGWSKGYDVARVIDRLYARGDGGFTTPVARVASQVRHACPKCCDHQWSTRLAYPDDLDERELRRLRNRLRN